MSEENKEINAVENNDVENKSQNDDKKKEKRANRLEVLVAIFLGLTALLTAWASWISSLHGGNQATNYTKSNNLASEGNSEYNAGMQLYLSDLMAWNTMMEYAFDKTIAEANGNEIEAELITEKLGTFADQNCSQILNEALDKMTDEIQSPFEVEGVVEAYFTTANDLLAQSQALLEQGQKDNSNGDAYNLVSVIYSLVLFMLGIVGIFKGIPNRAVVLIIACVILVIATIYMVTIPMPTDFSFANYF